MKNILYVRKVGDVGEQRKDYRYRISMEKFAQIIYSSLGFPDRASNQKKRLFNTYYNDIFDGQFDIEKSEYYVILYNDVIDFYKNSSLEHFDQKYFYVIYLISKNKSIKEAVELIEQTLRQFKSGEAISDSRKLLQVSFKETLDSNIT